MTTGYLWFRKGQLEGFCEYENGALSFRWGWDGGRSGYCVLASEEGFGCEL